jgi:type VI secretion system secreted protein Hcp
MAVDMFLKIDGINGDSSAHKHKGEIEILSFSWGVTQTGSHSGGGGGGAGKAVVQDFIIVKEVGSTSPQIIEKCCRGEHIPSVSLTLASKETKLEYMKIKLEDVLISSYQTGGAGGGSAAMDEVKFNFSRIDVQAANSKGQLEQVSCDFGKGVTTDGPAGHNHDH